MKQTIGNETAKISVMKYKKKLNDLLVEYEDISDPVDQLMFLSELCERVTDQTESYDVRKIYADRANS